MSFLQVRPFCLQKNYIWSAEYSQSEWCSGHSYGIDLVMKGLFLALHFP